MTRSAVWCIFGCSFSCGAPGRWQPCWRGPGGLELLRAAWEPVPSPASEKQLSERQQGQWGRRGRTYGVGSTLWEPQMHLT